MKWQESQARQRIEAVRPFADGEPVLAAGSFRLAGTLALRAGFGGPGVVAATLRRRRKATTSGVPLSGGFMVLALTPTRLLLCQSNPASLHYGVKGLLTAWDRSEVRVQGEEGRFMSRVTLTVPPEGQSLILESARRDLGAAEVMRLLLEPRDA